MSSNARRLARTAAALAAAASLAAAAPARAQDACEPEILRDTTKAPGTDRLRLLAHAAQAGFPAVLDSLAREWRAFPPDAQVPAPLAARFATELVALRDAVRDVYEAPDAERTALAARRVHWGTFLPETPREDGPWRLFDMDVPRATSPSGAASPAHAAVCTRAVLTFAVADSLLRRGRDVAARRYAAFADEWRAYERSTPTQYPWELALNGFVPRRSLSPRRLQLLALHPSAAGEATFGQSRSFRELVTMEWAGVVYSWSGYRQSVGLSGATALRRNAPAGVGGLLRYGRSLAIGPMTWKEDGKRRWSTVMTLDAYRLLTGTPADVKSAVAAAATREGAAARAVTADMRP